MATKIELEEMLFKLQCDQMESNKTRKKIEIQNLSALEVSFYPETLKDENSLKGILLNPFESSKKFDYAEIEAQIRANNILFVGRDGKGKNATIRICDFEMHKDLFDLPDATEYPAQLTKDIIAREIRLYMNVPEHLEILPRLLYCKDLGIFFLLKFI